MLICPLKQGIIIHARVIRTPPRTSFRLALQIGVSGTHDGLPEIVEAMSRVVSHLLLQLDAAVSALEVFDEV